MFSVVSGSQCHVMGLIKFSPRGTHSTLLVVMVTFIITCRYLYFKTISTPTPAAMKLNKPHTMSEATILPYQVSHTGKGIMAEGIGPVSWRSGGFPFQK